MAMQLQELFDLLMDQRTLTVQFISKQTTETLRTGLLRKLRAHKELWDKHGFATDETMSLGVGCKISDELVTFSIKEKKRTYRVEYQILQEPTGADVSKNLALD